MAHHATMTLYSQPDSVHSHRVRLVMAEKGISRYKVVDLPDEAPCEDLLDLNPYHTAPTLVERELVVYDARNILEYLDERYPHPALLPVDPMTRAQYRVAMFWLETDLYTLCDDMGSTPSIQRKARQRMTEVLTRLARGLAADSWLGETYSLLDCTLAPVLWRLSHYRTPLPARYARHIIEYAHRLFERPAFQEGLSAMEADMKPDLNKLADN